MRHFHLTRDETRNKNVARNEEICKWSRRLERDKFDALFIDFSRTVFRFHVAFSIARPCLPLLPCPHQTLRRSSCIYARNDGVGHNGSAVASYCARRQHERNKNVFPPTPASVALRLFSREQVTQLLVIAVARYKLISNYSTRRELCLATRFRTRIREFPGE